MKRFLLTLIAIVLTLSLLAGCKSDTGSKGKDSEKDVKIGVILVGDKTEGYTKAHIDGIIAAEANVGLADSNILWKYSVPESDVCYTTAKELIANGCTLIISNSYGHQDYMAQAAEEFPEVNFVAMTGDYASISGLKNLYNAFTDVYESRYVTGVVAGMKLAELAAANKIPDTSKDADGNVKIGYVGAFPYAEVVSGYTAFYLGIKSVYPQVAMEVTYTNSWFDIEGEAAAAESLMADGCVVIGQHADSTGAPTAVQTAQDKNGTVAYSVGYNVSMLEVAPKASLTSATNEWSVYYTELFKAFLDKKALPADWAEGYSKSAVAITKLGEAVAPGTAEKVKEVEDALKAGTLHVFDCSTFTVGGQTLTTAPVDLSYYDFSSGSPVVVHQGKTEEAIKTDSKGIAYFD